MLKGIKLRAAPTEAQKLVLSQWMGCARFIWNAKCDEDRYFRTYARKYCPVGTYAPVDAKAAHFKDKALSPWLYQCPSQIIRNSATNWYQTYQKFMKGECGRPKRKRKSDKGSIYLTNELFRFDRSEDGRLKLFIGTKTNNIGYLSFIAHADFALPKSLYIRKQAGTYTVSFCYEVDNQSASVSDQEQLALLSGSTEQWLENHVIGIDRGVKIPVYAGDDSHHLTPQQLVKMAKREKYLKRLQKRLSKQQKGSGRRQKTKEKIAKQHNRIANIREDFCHQTSRKLVSSNAKVFIFENLKTAQMTKRPKPKQNEKGQYIANRAKQKAGLNKSILNIGWHKLEVFTQYKAKQAGKAVFKIAPNHTSQECAKCGHIHPDNRKTQSHFECGHCGHIDNADRNATQVIKDRAIKLLLDSGTELVGKGIPVLTKGRGAVRKSSRTKVRPVVGSETSKKTRKATVFAVA